MFRLKASYLFGWAEVFANSRSAREGKALKHRGPTHMRYRLAICFKSWEATDLGNRPRRDNSSKWLGEGAQGLLDPASRTPLASVQNEVAPVQKDSWDTFAPWDQRPFAPSPNHFSRYSLFGQLPRSAVSQVKRSQRAWALLRPPSGCQEIRAFFVLHDLLETE